MAAPDPVACWGAAELMRREFGLPITAITGPATDNEVGQVYITGRPGAAGAQRAAGRGGAAGGGAAGARRVGRAAEPAPAGGRRRGPPSRPLRRRRLDEGRGGRRRRIRRRRAAASAAAAPRGRPSASPPAGARRASRSPRRIPRWRRSPTRASRAPTPGEVARGRDVVFLCLEHGESSRVAGEVFDAGPGLVVDLAADFRVRDPGALRALLRARTPRPSCCPASPTGWPTSSATALRGARRHRRAGLLRHRRAARALSAGPGAGSTWRRRCSRSPARAAPGCSPGPRPTTRCGPTTCSPTRCWGTGTRPRSCSRWREWIGPTRRDRPAHDALGPVRARASISRCTPGSRRDAIAAASRDHRGSAGIREAYAGRPFVRVLDAPPELTHAVGTNYALIHAGGERGWRGDPGDGRDRQPGEGRRRAGDPGDEPGAGYP